MPVFWFLAEAARAALRDGVGARVAAPAALRPAHEPRLEVPHRGRVPLGRWSSGVVVVGNDQGWNRVDHGAVGDRRRGARARGAAGCACPGAASSSRRSADGSLHGLPRHAAPVFGHVVTDAATPTRSGRSRERFHGRHVLNRYEDGMEKCIGCELCAGVCPARCIYVRGADNPTDAPVSPGERYGFVYEINYLRCIHCDLCVEACPTEAITETKLFEFSFTQPRGRDLHQGRAPRRRRRPRPPPAVGAVARRRGRPHERVDARDVARRARPRYEGRVGWSGELGFGVREPERGQSAAAGAAAAAARAPQSRDDGAARVTEILFFVVRRARARRCARRGRCSRNPVHSALFLVLTLVSVAVLLPAAGRRAPRGGADHRLRGRDRRAVPVRDHAARRRPRGVARRPDPVPAARGARARCAPAGRGARSSPATTGRPARRRRGVPLRAAARAGRRLRQQHRAGRPRCCSPTSSGRSRSPPRCS